jgi:medium-chain acyl-[acyl-carrier-protein] hydrolase
MGSFLEFFKAKSSNPKARLFCFPFAGSGAQMFFPWAELIPSQIELVGIQPPGRWNRLGEPPILSTCQLASECWAEIQTMVDVPYLLFGYSWGAQVAFEVMRLAHSDAKPMPSALIVAAAVAPQIPISRKPFHKLPDAEFVKVVFEYYKNVPQQILDDPEMLSLMMGILRADITAFESYSYKNGPIVDVPIFAFNGKNDAIVPEEAVNEWAKQTTGGFQLETIEGGHFFAQENLDLFIQSLNSKLKIFI